MGQGGAGINKEAEPSDEAFFLALIKKKNAPDGHLSQVRKERVSVLHPFRLQASARPLHTSPGMSTAKFCDNYYFIDKETNDK